MNDIHELALTEPSVLSFSGIDELSVFTCDDALTYIRVGAKDTPGDVVGIPAHLIGPLWRTLRGIEEGGR